MKKEYKILKDALLSRENILSVKKIGRDKIRIEIDESYEYLYAYDVLRNKEEIGSEIGWELIWDNLKDKFTECIKFENAFLVLTGFNHFNTIIYSVDFRIVRYDDNYIDHDQSDLSNASIEYLINNLDGAVISENEHKELDKNENIIWKYHPPVNDNDFPEGTSSDEYECIALDLDWKKDITIYVYKKIN